MTTDIDSIITERARHFGLGDRHGGWLLAADVACCVEPGEGQIRGLRHVGNLVANDSGKVSARTFAERAGTSHTTVMKYLRTWQAAALQGVVPAAEELTPRDTPVLHDAESWSVWWLATNPPPRPRPREPEPPEPPRETHPQTSAVQATGRLWRMLNEARQAIILLRSAPEIDDDNRALARSVAERVTASIEVIMLLLGDGMSDEDIERFLEQNDTP
jgi:hypothetical protein